MYFTLRWCGNPVQGSGVDVVNFPAIFPATGYRGKMLTFYINFDLQTVFVFFKQYMHISPQNAFVLEFCRLMMYKAMMIM